MVFQAVAMWFSVLFCQSTVILGGCFDILSGCFGVTKWLLWYTVPAACSGVMWLLLYGVQSGC